MIKNILLLIAYFIGILAFCYMILYSLNAELEMQEKKDISYQSYINKNEIKN